jgi:hypothetical protein
MKTAILISGYLQCFDKTYRNLLNNISDARKSDIFIYTFDTYEDICTCHQCYYRKPHLDVINTFSIMDQVKAAYKPKNIVVSYYKQLKETIKDNTDISFNDNKYNYFDVDILSYFIHLFARKRLLEMVEEQESVDGSKYDMIISCRFDQLLANRIILASSVNPDNGIYVPHIASHYKNGINEQFCIGGRKAMQTYLSLYDAVAPYYCSNVVEPLVPETILKHYLSANDIRTNTLGVNYYILRTDGTYLQAADIYMEPRNDWNSINHLMV